MTLGPKFTDLHCFPKLKPDQLCPRDYLHMKPHDDRHTDKFLRLVMVFVAQNLRAPGKSSPNIDCFVPYTFDLNL